MLASGLQGNGLMMLVERTVQSYLAHDMSTHTAALSFRSRLTLSPFIIFLLTLLGALGVPEFFRWLLDQA